MEIFTDKELITTINSKISSNETDMNSRLRLGVLVNYLLQSAIVSADKLGFGLSGIKQQELFWVLSRLTVDIQKPFIWYDKIEIETWPKTLEKILYIRDFFVKDDEGNLIVKATSAWFALDFNTKRPKKIEESESMFFNRLKERNAIEKTPEKIPPVECGDKFDIKTVYFDIDLNGHVNSTRYIDWMMDTFSVDFLKINYPKQLTMNYLMETMLGDSIQIIRKAIDNQYYFEGINLSKDATAFRGKLVF